MSFAVVPLGVLAALYLREYAKQGTLVRTVRIAVNNLAGVPSVVYGVFGFGFFVYFVGGSIDQAFFADKLPAPTFGTPGLLWSSLTLALLTVPVVIVATEEGLTRIPRAIRESQRSARGGGDRSARPGRRGDGRCRRRRGGRPRRWRSRARRGARGVIGSGGGLPSVRPRLHPSNFLLP